MRSNDEWIYWGKVDPLWAVCSIPGKRKGSAHPWTAEALLKNGAAYFEGVWRQWRSYGMGHEHCVEIGCGSGRITNQLLSAFNWVTALDVSPEQIENARRLIGEKAKRVNFVVVTAPHVPVPDESIDGMFSCEVFQHLSSFDGVAGYLKTTFVKLKPGGSICFQIPVIGLHSYSRIRHLCRRILTTTQRIVGGRSIMDYRFHRAPRILHTLKKIGYVDCELRMFSLADHEAGPHLLLCAQAEMTTAPETL